MGLFSGSNHAEDTRLSEDNASAGLHVSQDREKEASVYDDSPVKFLSMRSLAMGVLVSMGGFIFGYDTGTSHLRKTARELANSIDDCRSNIRLSSNERLSQTFWRRPGQWKLPIR